MNIRIDCIYNKNGTRCTNIKVKRAFFGFGPRYCYEYNGKICSHMIVSTRPNVKPKPTKKKWAKIEEKSDGPISWTEYTDHNGMVYIIYNTIVAPSFSNAELKISDE